MSDKDMLEFVKGFFTLSPKGQLLISCLVNAYVRCDDFEIITIKRAIVDCWSGDVNKVLLDQILQLEGGSHDANAS